MRTAGTKKIDSLDSRLESIARACIGVETLEARGSDSLDFHDVAVWQLKAALEAAYRAGAESARIVR